MITPVISGAMYKRCKEGTPLEYWSHRQLRVMPNSTVEYCKSFYDDKAPSRATLKHVSVIDDELLVLHCKGRRLCFKSEGLEGEPEIDDWHRAIADLLFLNQDTPAVAPQLSSQVA